MKEVPGSEFRIAVDMVLLALGFDPVVDPRLTEQLGIETDDRGVPIVRDFATTTEGVFAAGDLVTGPSYVVTAINSAREAAEKIGQFLRATVSVDA